MPSRRFAIVDANHNMRFTMMNVFHLLVSIEFRRPYILAGIYLIASHWCLIT